METVYQVDCDRGVCIYPERLVREISPNRYQIINKNGEKEYYPSTAIKKIVRPSRYFVHKKTKESVPSMYVIEETRGRIYWVDSKYTSEFSYPSFGGHYGYDELDEVIEEVLNDMAPKFQDVLRAVADHSNPNNEIQFEYTAVEPIARKVRLGEKS